MPKALCPREFVPTEPVVHQRSHSAMPHHAERDGDFSDIIGTTSNHPFWSVDRQEYVQAGHLEIGERLQTLHGDTKTVASNLPRPGPKTDVYNLEVHAEHTYFVGEDGVLVHNNRVYTVADEAGQIVYVGKYLTLPQRIMMSFETYYRHPENCSLTCQKSTESYSIE